MKIHNRNLKCTTSTRRCRQRKQPEHTCRCKLPTKTQAQTLPSLVWMSHYFINYDWYSRNTYLLGPLLVFARRGLLNFQKMSHPLAVLLKKLPMTTQLAFVCFLCFLIRRDKGWFWARTAWMCRIILNSTYMQTCSSGMESSFRDAGIFHVYMIESHRHFYCILQMYASMDKN